MEQDEQSKKAAEDDPLLVNLTRAGHDLGGLKRSAVYELLKANRLESVHIGRRRLVVRASIERLVEELRAEARARQPSGAK